MVKTETKQTVKISPYSKIKVYWDDKPENYNREAKNRIRNLVSKKYGVNKNNIDIIYRPVKFTDTGDVIEIDGATIENIMDINYQRQLIKEWLNRENKVIDYERLLKLDDKINNELNIEFELIKDKKWSIKWLYLNNFLSFGEKNYLPFNKLKGLSVVNSMPANQGGKTTLTIDSLKFLLHGNTTKTDKNEEIFNQFSGKNELLVKGMIEISGEEIIIERKMKRTPKKGGGWTVTNKVNYYKILPDGEEEQLNEEDAIRTTLKLRNTIGNEKDFEMLVLATEKNLEDLVGLSSTESSKILTRLIGLEIIEQKEAIVRKMFNEFDKTKKSNLYDIITLTDEIKEHEENIETLLELQKNNTTALNTEKENINNLNEKNDELLNSKITIDVDILTLNPASLEEEIKTITKNGKDLATKKNHIETKISELGEIDFNEDRHFTLTKKLNKLSVDIQVNESEINKTIQTIKQLELDGICKACNRKLDDVDNSEHIKKHINENKILKNKTDKLKEEKDKINEELEELNKIKKDVDNKNKLELEKDKIDVELGSLRNLITEKNNDLKKYKLNKKAIEFNINVDIEISKIKTDLKVANYNKDTLITKLEKINNEILNNKKDVQNKKTIITQIQKEQEVEKIFKVYIDLFGKKGISKLVLRSVLPIINSEVQRLLEDVCDFEVEIFIDDKNDIQFLLNKDEVSKYLKSGSGFEKTASSLALRAVLGKLSSLPMPNFITFDEVLGKVANENLEKLKPLFDKIKNMYEIVFIITHNDLVKDWADNVLTVIKHENISRINLN